MKIKHRRRVPYIEQMQQTECGLCCMAMIMRYYGSNEKLSEFREYIEAGRDGLKLSVISRYLSCRGFETHIYKAGMGSLKNLLLPSIIFWNQEHFVILESIEKNKFTIVDPAFGRRKVTSDEFKNQYSNYILTAEPTENFIPKKESRSIWAPVIGSMFRNKKIMAKVLGLSMIAYLISISIPIMMRYLIDEITLKNNPHYLQQYSIIVAGLIIISAVIALIRGRSLIDLQSALDRHLNSSIINKLFKLPYKYFESRSSGDLMFRIGSLNTIRDVMSEQVMNGMVNIGAMIFIGLYMTRSSPRLAGTAAIMFIATGMFIFYMRPKMMQANQCSVIENAKLQSVQAEAVYSMSAIKTMGIEDDINNKINVQYDECSGKFNVRERILNIYNTVISFTNTLNPFILLILGIYEYFSGRMTIGQAIAFYALSNMFFAAGLSLFKTWNSLNILTSYMERLNDITDSEEEYVPENPQNINIQGNIEVKDVSFAYADTSPPVINNINVSIKQGQKVAFVGPSGAGKSTLGKILLGLYHPQRGEIFYDGINLNEIIKSDIRKQIGVVPQDIYLFNKSIYENINMNKENVTMEMVREAAKIAQIDEEIQAMPMKYNTLVSDMGVNLSGGQRQRIAIARAIVNKPSVIILDEATSSLDSINEKIVSDYFKKAGCTMIVIAHRLSTIMDSDIIYVMDKGCIAESGTHKELMIRNGLYAGLYRGKERGGAEKEIV